MAITKILSYEKLRNHVIFNKWQTAQKATNPECGPRWESRRWAWRLRPDPADEFGLVGSGKPWRPLTRGSGHGCGGQAKNSGGEEGWKVDARGPLPKIRDRQLLAILTHGVHTYIRTPTLCQALGQALGISAPRYNLGAIQMPH